MGHLHEIVSFEGTSGDISATLQLPEGPSRGAVVLSHCFTCSKSLKVTRYFATAIEDGGYAVLRHDFTGLGESEGDFAETSVTTNISDIEAAARYMHDRDLGPCALVGHSLGGTATLLAGGNVDAVEAVAVIAAPFSADHVHHLFTDADRDSALASGRAKVTIGGRPFEIAAEFFHDLEKHCSPDRIADLNRPLQVVHGTRDTTVDIAEGIRVFEAANQPKWFTAIPGAGHLFGNELHAMQAGQAVVAFLDTVLSNAGEAPPRG